MATKNKKDIVTDLLANIYTNTNKEIKAVMVQRVINDLTNSMSVNITVAQLRVEDDSAEPSWVNIIDVGKWGIFFYDPSDTTTTDDGGGICILSASNKRYKRLIDRTVNARWFGNANYYFNDIASANAAVKVIARFVGLEVVILNNGVPSNYWWIGGTADANLVIKNPEIQVLEFSPGDGGAYTPGDGTSVLVNPALASVSSIVGFFAGSNKVKVLTWPTTRATDELYAQFKKSENKLILQNGQYVATTDYSLMYK